MRVSLLLTLSPILVTNGYLLSDPWPLVTPLLGDISAPCKEASHEYKGLLSQAMERQMLGAPLTSDQRNALRRLDSNGQMPFLQEGILQDTHEFDLCSVLGELGGPGDLVDLCDKIPDDLTVLQIPFGNAAGPGLERTCRHLQKSKYCHNNMLRLSVGNSEDVFNPFIHTDAQNLKTLALGLNLQNNLSKNYQNAFDGSFVIRKKSGSNTTIDTKDTTEASNNILIEKIFDQNSYMNKLQEALTKLYIETSGNAIEDETKVGESIFATLITLWYIQNWYNGPIAGVPFPYQGVCYPSACTERDIHNNNLEVAKLIFSGDKVIAFTPLNMPGFEGVGCTDREKYNSEWKSENYAVVVLFCCIGVLVLMGTFVDVYHRSSFGKKLAEKNKIERPGLFKQILTAFSLQTNLEFIFKPPMKKGSNRLDCLEGIRAISMTWVILGHNFAFGSWFMHGRNKEYIQQIQGPEKAGGLAFEAIAQGEYSVDTFLFIGATLLSYLLLKDLDKSNGWFHAKGLVRVFFFYINRYLRITIPLALSIAFFVGITPLLITQPLRAAGLALSEAENCKEVWWRHLLFFNIWGRYDGGGDSCIGQTWYLAFDMEWFLVSPLIVYPLWLGKYGRTQKLMGIIWWCMLFAGFFIAHIVYVYRGDDIERYSSEHFLPNWNFAPWGWRSHCYMLGLMTGYILHETKDKEIKISNALNLSIWSFVFLVAFSLIYGPYNITSGLEHDAYEAMMKTSWGLCLAWVVIACVKGYGGPVNDFLSWGLWASVSKISFMTYLFHMSWNWYYFNIQDYNVDFSMWLMTQIFVAQLFVDLSLGLAASLTLELPFGKIQKILLQKLLGGRG